MTGSDVEDQRQQTEKQWSRRQASGTFNSLWTSRLPSESPHVLTREETGPPAPAAGGGAVAGGGAAVAGD